MSKFTICISSVIEKEDSFRDYRYIAKAVIEDMGHEAIRNPEEVRTQMNYERVLNEDCDFFVLIIGDKKSEMVEKELRIALSKGTPILAFAKIHYNKDGKTVLPEATINSIKAISPELYNMQIVTFEHCEKLAKVLKRELESEIDRRVKLTPIIGIDPPIAYTEGVRLIRDAKYRLIVAQKTSCLFLGPRMGISYEKTFYDELIKWIHEKRDQAGYFLHYYSLEETLKAAKTGEYSLKIAKENLEKIFKETSNTSFFIRCSDTLETVSHVIGDTGLGFNFYVGKNRYYLFLPCFMTKDSELQQIIANVQNLGKQQTWDTLLQMYNQLGV